VSGLEEVRDERQAAVRHQQLDAVRTIAAEIAREPHFPALLALISRRATELLQAASGAIYLWEEVEGTLVPHAWVGVEDWLAGIRWRLGEGLPGIVAQRREGLIVEDYQTWPQAHPLFRERGRVTAALAEPLLSRDALLGVIAVDDSAAGRRFTDEDRTLLALLASQAAIAIENARLRGQVVQRNDEVQALFTVTDAVTRSLDVAAVARAALQTTLDLLRLDAGRLYIFDEQTRLLRLLEHRGLPPEAVPDLASYAPGEGIVGRIFQDGQPIVFADMTSDPRYAAIARRTVSVRLGFRSAAGLAILIKGRPVGVIYVGGRAVREFLPSDLALLSAIGGQIGAAIENARLFADVKQRNDELQALFTVTDTVSRSLDIGCVAEAALRATLEVLRLDAGRLYIFDEQARLLRLAAHRGLPPEVMADFASYAPGQGVVGRVFQESRPLSFTDMTTDASYAALTRSRLGIELGFHSAAAVPILVQGRSAGAVHVFGRAVREFTPSDLALLAAIGSQIGAAIENARLHDSTRRELIERTRSEAALRVSIAERRRAEQALTLRTRHLEAIRSISHEITRNLDLGAVLDLIVRRAAALVGATACSIRLWDEQHKLLLPAAHTGSDRHSASVPLRAGEGVAGAATEQRRGLIVNDFRSSPHASPALLEDTTHAAVMATPLLYGDRLVGALAITREATEPPFGDADLEALNLFAPHAAIAIENARLHQAVAKRAEQLGALNRVTQSLMMHVDREGIGREVMRAVQVLMPGAAARLWDLAEDTDASASLELIASVGLQDAAGGVVRFRRGEGLAGRAFSLRRPLISLDLTEDPRFVNKDWAAKEGLVSAVLFPLLVGERGLGILAIFLHVRHEFSDAEISILQALADHAAIAVDKAALYRREEARARQLDAVRLVTAEITRERDLATLLDTVTRRAAELVGASGGMLRLWDAGCERLVPAAWHGLPEWLAGRSLRLGESAAGMAAARREAIIVNDFRASAYATPLHLEHTTHTAVLAEPLLYRDKVVGVVVLVHEDPGRAFSAEDEKVLRLFAHQAAIAIENALLHEAVRRHAAELEGRVRERTAALEEALQAKSQFLATMSHELRTPLNFVLGFSEVLRDGRAGPLTPKQAQFLDRVHLGGRHLLDLVNDMLDLTLTPQETSGLRLERVAMAPLVADALELYGVLIVQKALRVTPVIQADLCVVAERRKLSQIVTVLLATAIKGALHGETVRVRAARVEGAPSRAGGGPAGPPADAAVEIEVEYVGEGLSEADLGVPEAGSCAGRPGAAGPGISLALVRTLVELHGGRVRLEQAGSEPRTRFVVYLPPLALPPPPGVLIAAERDDFLRALVIFLRDAGYQVRAVASGAEAVAAAAAEPPHLLVLGRGLADTAGRELLRRLRGEPATAAVPVLFLADDKALAREACALGADEALVLPVPLGAIAAALRELGRRPRDSAGDPGVAGVARGPTTSDAAHGHSGSVDRLLSPDDAGRGGERSGPQGG
jgi:GAF domain-containing protein/ActR/RegA family two-component response regulator